MNTLLIEDTNELTDGCLPHIASICSLRKLYIGWSNFTDAGLIHLTGRGLEYLNVEDCEGITDEGLRLAGLHTVASYG